MQTSFLHVLYVLTRFPVTLAVTFTAFTALLLVPGEIRPASFIAIGGIFLLASGASAFNQYQEWPFDEKMERTRRRPVPSRRISTGEAQRIVMLSIIGGTMLLLYYAPPVCFVLGLTNLVWYNGIYTYLKRKTAFAVVPGALTGAIPIYMGWTAAGGALSAHEPLFLSFFIFIWQMPHFWLLTLKYGDEYRNAGFPVLTDRFSEFQVRAVVMGWMIAASAASLMLVYFRILGHIAFAYTLAGINILLLLVMAQQLFMARTIRYRLIFIVANSFMLVVMLSLIADRFLKG